MMKSDIYRGSEEFRDIFNNISDCVFILDKEANYIDFNDAGTELTGYSRKELLSMKVSDLLVVDDSDKSLKFFKKLQEEGRYEGFMGRMKSKSGEIKIIEVSSKAILNENGEIIGSRDIIRDISERIRMENALLESEYKFRTIIENSESVIYIIDNNGIFQLSEGKGLKSLGLKPGEIVGQSIYEIYKDFPKITGSFENALKGEKISTLIDLGDTYYQSFYSPFKNSEGTIIGVLGSGVEVTERIKREQMLEKARVKAEEADQLKSSFLANMSHEIRTPMNAILGFSALLKNENIEKDTQKEYLNIIESKGKELLELLTDLIDISKIESGNVNIISENIGIKNLLAEMAETAKQSLILHRKNEIRIILSIPENNPDISVKADQGRMKQVLNNLVSNALKFTDKGSITIGYDILSERFVDIYVEDTGIGIPEDKLSIIFDRFRQVEETLSRNRGGTGLGLYISKTIVNHMGGKLDAVSEPGKGSKFSFSLPIVQMETENEDSDLTFDHSKAVQQLKNKFVFIVEDEESNFRYLEILLKRYGSLIQRAENGEKAVEMIKNGISPDIILMDIKLPGITGLETIRIIKKIQPNIPIIAQTAHAFNNDRFESLTAGCNDYLSKPIKANELIPKILRLL